MKDIDDLSPRERLEQSLPLIAKLVRRARFRHAMSEDEAEEFHAALLLKLVEGDYAVLRRFKGRSRFSTYLTTVVQHALLDFRDARWGRWRPSAWARRRGDLAVRLETLIARDGLATSEAVATLAADPDVREPEATIDTLAAQLPQRLRRKVVGPSALEHLPGDSSADERAERHERVELATEVQRTVREALAALSAEERLLIRLRYLEGLPVRKVASVLDLPAKPLYRRFENILRRLRAALEGHGVDWPAAAAVIGRPEIDLHLTANASKAAGSIRSRTNRRRSRPRGSGVGPGHRIHAGSRSSGTSIRWPTRRSGKGVEA